MDFYAILDQVVALLRQRQRVTYRALKVQFHLDDEALEALKDELLYAQPQVRDDAGRGLVWTGDPGTAPPAATVSMTPPARAGGKQRCIGSRESRSWRRRSLKRSRPKPACSRP